MPDVININSRPVHRGELAQIKLNIARLPSHTVIDLPIFVYRAAKDGPVLLLTAGLHGDELNGIETIRRMIVEKLVIPTAGTVIAVPVVNIYGFLNTARDLPDGKDLNRSFPGSKLGSLARRIAHAFVREVIPNIDFGVDFHTGGASRTNYPQIRCLLDDVWSLKLARAFSPPFIINSKFIDKSLRKAAYKRGKRIIVYEGGESSRFDERAIREGIKGTVRLMHYLKMSARTYPKNDSVLLASSHWIRARSSGLFRGYIKVGEQVKRKQVLATITDPFGESELRVKADQDGYVIGLNKQPVVNQGDAVIHLGVKK